MAAPAPKSASLQSTWLVQDPEKQSWSARRFVLQPGSVPEQHRLASQMGALRMQCRELETAGRSSAGDDFADVSLVAEARSFRQAVLLICRLIQTVWCMSAVMSCRTSGGPLALCCSWVSFHGMHCYGYMAAGMAILTNPKPCRCHCCVLTARSDYFAALLVRSELSADKASPPAEGSGPGSSHLGTH